MEHEGPASQQVASPKQPADFENLPIEIKQKILVHVASDKGGYTDRDGKWVPPSYSRHSIEEHIFGKKAYTCWINRAWYRASVEFFRFAM